LNSFELIYAQVKRIPRGKVATYGLIAALAGNKNWSRVVGYALHVNPSQSGIPCHRVVNRYGGTSSAFAFGGKDIQRDLLEKEGVIFRLDGTVDMEKCLWDGSKPQNRKSAFPPLIDKGVKTLILGTFPSPLSREKGEYYGNPQNKFWQIIFAIFGEKFDNPDYETKKAVLFKNNLALWDVIKECEVVGAADSAIREPDFNTELPYFIKENGIRNVVFNGKKAYEFYQKGIGKIDGVILPSTSPANAGIGFDEKLRRWGKAING